MAEIQGLEIAFEPPPQRSESGTEGLDEYVESLVTWVEQQLQRQANISQNYSYVKMEEAVLGDGSDWDPGSGAGYYGYHGAAWTFLGGVPTATFTRAATIVESRALLASASATIINNNNVLAALIADLQARGVIL